MDDSRARGSGTTPEAAREAWREEMRSAFLYRVLARVEDGPARADLFTKLAAEAEEQATVWAKIAGIADGTAFVADARTRVVAALVVRLGPRRVRGALAAMKVRGLSVYDGTLPGHEPPAPGAHEKRHRGTSSGGTLRAAVFGVNDGLLSNCSLLLGVVGAAPSPKIVLLTGVAGMLAGAFSMAAGELVSVRSQREMFEYQIGLERAELAEYPEEEEKELALVYAARGLSPADAAAMAARVMSDPARALDTLAREELGLNPSDLGSPWGAAISSFTAFALGAVIPLAPFVFASGTRALVAMLATTGITLFVVGAVISLFTGRSALRDGARMLAIGAAVGALTYAIGRVMGVSLS